MLWQIWPGGSICLWYLYVYIYTGISLYLLISWLFQTGSHWWHWTVKSSLCALAVSNGGSICLWYLHVFYMHWYFLIYSYKLTVLNGLSSVTLKSKEFTLCSGSFEWGVYCKFYPGKSEIYMFSICTGISLYFLISWLFWMGSHWWHWTVKSSLCALAVLNGGVICLWYLHVFYMHWYILIFSYKLTVSNGLSLMALKSKEFTLCSGSFEWGVYCKFYPGKSEICMFSICTGISLYFLISWLFWMGSHWWHWTVKSSLCALAVLNGGSSAFGIYMFSICTGISLYFLISWLFWMGSHWWHWKAKSSLCALAVLNGGVYHKFYPCKSENLSSLAFLCFASTGLFILHMKDLMKTVCHFPEVSCSRLVSLVEWTVPASRKTTACFFHSASDENQPTVQA